MTARVRPEWRRRRLSLGSWFLIGSAALTVLGLLILTLRSIEPSADISETTHLGIQEEGGGEEKAKAVNDSTGGGGGGGCATVEEMGKMFGRGSGEESLRARQMISSHFHLNGAPRVRALPPEQFCRHGFVLGKASEAGFGNEMYKILTAAAISVMLNRSLIIGQTRGKYPFGDYILYSNLSFTLAEVKHLWRMNGCVAKYGRHLVMRIDDFQKPSRTNVLCGNWRKWRQPIIWFQNTTDAVAAQFFLKSIHLEMRKAASDLFGEPENLQYRPNVFGELMRALISPSGVVEHALNWALSGGADPDIAVHMRMLMNRSVRAVRAALNCVRKAAGKLSSRPKVVLVSDTPSLVEDIGPNLVKFAEVLHFDYEHFEGNITAPKNKLSNLNPRVRDWGPAPRWVAFVDFFLASRAKHAVVSGAHRRVGTTYAQLIAALAAAHRLGDNSSAGSSFTYLSSFQSNLLSKGLRNQIGWGHVWNRFAGPLSCSHQPNQCAFTPILPPGWWDGLWQSPIPRDVKRMEAYGIRLSGLGTVDEDYLHSFCSSRKVSANMGLCSCFGNRKKGVSMMMNKQHADTKGELEFYEDEEAALASTLTPSSSSSVKMPETLKPTLRCGVLLDSSHAQNCNPTFSYRELASATNNFRRECLIGEGGFGCIYKGKIVRTGQVVAIKKLDPSGFQGTKEFLVEVLMLSLLHHPNLVDLVGFCAEGEQRLLVYELLPLGSLEYHLHDLPPDMQPLDWNTRMKIAAGIAEGLDYLHNQADPPVIHRDLKSSNILLGEGFHPKLSDFGLAKFGPPEDKSHVSTRVMGTRGYCAPEYYDTGKLTTKSDIYCFGIVLLEIITGRRALDTTEEHGKQTLLEWARPLLKDRKNLRQLADQQLQGQFSDYILRRAVDIALMCLQDNPQSRPPIRDLVSAMKYLATQEVGRHAAHDATQDGKRKGGRVCREEGKRELITDVEGAGDASRKLNTFTSNKDEERARAVAEAKQWGESCRAKMQLCPQIEPADL